MRANDFLTEQPGTIAVTNTPIADKNISMGDQRMQKFKQQMQKDGGYQYTSQATKDAIKKSDKRVQTAMQKQAQVDQRQGAGASTIQRVKPVTFPKATSTAQIAMDDINEAFEQAIFEDEVTLEDTQDFHEEYGYLGYSIDENDIFEAEYRGRKVKLNKPMQGDVKKFKVYVKNKKGNVIKVNFGHGGSSVKGKTMRIRKSNPKARKSFRARHNCDNPGPKTKARYWSCRKW